MSDVVNIQKRVEDLNVSPEQSGYSKVVLIVGIDENGNQITYEAGNDNGKTLYLNNPFGTQQMANNILEKVRGFQYQPFEARNAIYDPAVEMGDGVSINGIYSGIYVRATDFGDLFSANISAPHDEEIEAEQGLQTASDRQYTRFLSQTNAGLYLTNQKIEAEVSRAESAETSIRATLVVQAEQIEARVTKTGGNSSSFGWSLESDRWRLFSNSKTVLEATNSGITVNGKIQAESGYIGGANGFVITANKLYKNISSMSGTQSSGVYIGTDGIKLGQKFKVDSSGTVSASSLTLTGGAIKLTKQSLSDANNGVYIGSDGIALGPSSKFKVTAQGAVTASNLTLTGGSINIGNKFIVDSNGNLTATSGTFSGNVRANKITVGGDAGYITGSQIGSSTITGSKIASQTISGGNGGNIQLATISEGNTLFTETLNQVGYNAEDITIHDEYFDGRRSASFMSISTLYAGETHIGSDYGGDVYYKGSLLTRVMVRDLNGDIRDVLGFY